MIGNSVYETCALREHSMIVPPSYSLMYPTHFSRSIMTSFVNPCFWKYPTALLSANVMRCVIDSLSQTYSFRWFMSRVPYPLTCSFALTAQNAISPTFCRQNGRYVIPPMTASFFRQIIE
eukprot:30179-Pelagococcus_subviridis.AAC.3